MRFSPPLILCFFLSACGGSHSPPANNTDEPAETPAATIQARAGTLAKAALYTTADAATSPLSNSSKSSGNNTTLQTTSLINKDLGNLHFATAGTLSIKETANHCPEGELAEVIPSETFLLNGVSGLCQGQRTVLNDIHFIELFFEDFELNDIHLKSGQLQIRRNRNFYRILSKDLLVAADKNGVSTAARVHITASQDTDTIDFCGCLLWGEQSYDICGTIPTSTQLRLINDGEETQEKEKEEEEEEEGEILDFDRDGFTIETGDCDDRDPGVHPQATETCNDGKDNNCDGSANGCDVQGILRVTSLAHAKLQGEAAGDTLYQGTTLGDVNQDGFEDILLGSFFHDGNALKNSGACYLLYGRQNFAASGSVGTLANAKWVGTSIQDLSCAAFASAGDINRDGRPDILIGSHGEAAYILYGGDLSGTRSLADADVKLLSEWSGVYTGYSVFSADVNGDHISDILVGDPYEDSAGRRAGAVYLMQGPLQATRSLDSATNKWTGMEPGRLFGNRITSGDVNGDGLSDIIVSSHGSGGTAQVHLIYGPATQTTPDATFTGETSGDLFQACDSLGDINGDGLDDLLFEAANHDSARGALYVKYGQAAKWSGNINTFDAIIRGETAGDYFGNDCDVMGDFNGDGRADVVAGAYLADPNDLNNGGKTYLFYGPLLESLSASAANVQFTGERSGDALGASVHGGGDFNRDGLDDLLIGAEGEDSNGRSAGAVYLIYGRGR